MELISPAIYVIVRDDLCPAQTAVQGIHAAHHSGERHGAPEGCRVVLGSCSILDFPKWKSQLELSGIEFVEFYEPDISDFSAICSAPTTDKKAFRKLKLYAPNHTP